MFNFWRTIFLALAFFLLFLVFANFYDKLSLPDAQWDLSKGENKLEINPASIVMQKFRAEKNNLSKIRMLFSKSNNKDGGEITIKLTDENCKNIIREETFKRSSIKPEGYYDFKFSKIKDSENKTFCLSIEFNPGKEKYKGLNIFLSNNPVAGSQLIDASGVEIKNSSLAMRPAYQEESMAKNIERLNQRISQYKPWFLKNVYLYATSFLFVFLTFFLVILIIFTF